MAFYLDCYALVRSRSAALARNFLDRFLPNRRSLLAEYWFPESADTPEAVFTSADELLAVLEERSTESHALYWSNTGAGLVRMAMVFPTRDGCMSLGLSVEEGQEEAARRLLDEMCQFVGTPCPAFIGCEEPPPDTSAAFLERAGVTK